MDEFGFPVSFGKAVRVTVRDKSTSLSLDHYEARGRLTCSAPSAHLRPRSRASQCPSAQERCSAGEFQAQGADAFTQAGNDHLFGSDALLV